ncbi:MAG: RagB/SusD family nutrient uptake outer membrane protein [Balneolaceae bacterium]
MMKKRLLILLIPMLVLSCGEDFTLLSPISERNTESFYKTSTDFEAAIVGAYDALQSNGTFGVNYILLMEMRADNGQNAGGATGLAASLQQIDDFKEIPTAGEFKTTWAETYKGISRTNSILSRIDDITFPNENLKKQIKGEALFIRSLLYYHLSVIFGNVTEQFEEVASLNFEINQVPASTIFARIASDLTEAEGLLPATTNNGRITSGAAAALLGRVYLQDGKKAEAVAPLQRVVDSAKYELVDDYKNIWGVDNKLNKESIFEIQYKSGSSEGSSYTDMYTPNGKGGGVGGGVSPVSPTTDVRGLFDAAALLGDERAAGTIAISVDTTATPNDTTFYVGKFDSKPTSAFDADNNWIEIRYAEVLLNLAEALGEGIPAYNLINEVRDRAGLLPISAVTPGTFEEKLLNERRLEFAFENKRWADLLRFGKAKEVMATHLNITQAEVKLLFPIPQGEIDVSPDKMTQNSEHN